jgi:hypothetical protein
MMTSSSPSAQAEDLARSQQDRWHVVDACDQAVGDPAPDLPLDRRYDGPPTND